MFPELTRDDVFRLETRRLWLRWPRHSDAASIVSLAGAREVAEMTARIPHPYPPDAAAPYVLEARRAAMEGASLRLAMAPKAQPTRLVGMIGIEPNAAGEAEIGYWLGRPFWGQGLATEAARTMIDAFFAFTEGEAVAASVRVGNPASRRVLEKSGFVSEGPGFRTSPLRGSFPVDTFRLTRRDWASLKAWSRDGWAPPRPRAPDLLLVDGEEEPDAADGPRRHAAGSAAATAAGRPLFLAAE
ncbi:GNAT family N-acetyltransferase [Salinarimonas chemoclinalis]|uniref:GNAT family N-acetyltransferase n=1 Tax=Salinarimonas chemoclinalis TaxID=3241599 RepID=UPI0035588C9A